MDGFEDFFADNFEPVLRALSVAIGSQQEAEELAQEAFARAFRRWEAVAVMERPATWVYVVAIREFGKRRRRAQRWTARSQSLVADSRGRDPADPWAAIDDRADLARRIDALAPRQRVAVVLRYHVGLSLEEVATAMSCATGTVKATLHAALKNLRVEMEANVEP